MYYLADEPKVHFVWQPSQESSVLAMSRAFVDYYIMDYGVISAPEVTQRRTDNSDHFVILPTVGVVFLCWSAFNSLRKHTLAFLFEQARMVVCV
ncbi:Protein SAWADEE HOMEODOMAIN HOMOLOG 1 [Zea mays]|jgi:hypothetical protein|uniref:protein-serine/threonine phosphatase n=1 Tax=Zea mays TaxID=4577 RepID=A0A1D6I2M1_MAIZE|nr:Protein SAWADEE HOMEODOMAIN HOMOLOG 1 [Zea mays]